MPIDNTFIIEFGLGNTAITFTKLENLDNPKEPPVFGIALEKYTTAQVIGNEVHVPEDTQQSDESVPVVILAIHNIKGAMVLREALERLIAHFPPE